MTDRTIPIVAHDRWEREICARCVDPGACCRRFNLSGDDGATSTYWDDERPTHAQPTFQPLERWGQWTMEGGPDAGRTYSAWMWTCTALGADGRCTIYADRPDLCRRFEPLSDSLCVMRVSRETGAPR